ncbi:MAG: glycosyltransferase [Pseudomonadota bacterium]
MRVLQNPDRQPTNPYPGHLFEALIAAGADMRRYDARAGLTAGADILHVHWPQAAPPAVGVKARLIYWLRLIGERSLVAPILRARGGRIVWTVHNLGAHDYRPGPLGRFFWRRFLSQCDATVHLSEAGRARAFEELTAIAGKPSYVIPHGTYPEAEALTISRAAARAALGLPTEGRILLHFGMIRPYKNVPALIAAFAEAAPPDWRLVVAGKVHADAQGLNAALRAAADGAARVDLRLGYVDDEELGRLVRAADLCAFPYRQIFNSGSVHYALAAGRAVVVPASAVFDELAGRFGDRWFRRYSGALDASALAKLLADAPPTEDQRPDLSSIAWDRVAAATLAAYQDLQARSV